MTVQTEYRNAVYRALERCQFIEEILRLYLYLVIQVAKIELKSHFPVNLTKEDLSKLSLGRLVYKFSQFNGNVSLKSDLEKITPDRNKVVHQSLLLTLGENEDNKHLAKLTNSMNEFEKRAKKAHETLLDEKWKLQKSLRALRLKAKEMDEGRGLSP